MKKKLTPGLWLSLYHYACFFLLMAFLITCCMLLFLSALSKTMNLSFTGENTKVAALITFLNVLLLSALCTLIDGLRRKWTVERPVSEILCAAEKIAKGDYSVRIPPLHSFNRGDGLDRIVDCYNKMAEELSGIEMMQTDFVANVSHELKTPLAVMQNYATLLRSPSISDAEREEYARAVSEACRRLADLIGNILKLNKLENRQIFPSGREYDLSDQLCSSLLSFESVWEEKGIEIEPRIPEGVMVMADPELLSLVWNNLISNALKFTERGGRVSVTLETPAPSQIRVSVRDEGCGISPEEGRRIFDKFYQGDTSHATEGNGLGLALVKRVVDIFGGEISVRSEEGKGSTFTVTLGIGL